MVVSERLRYLRCLLSRGAKVSCSVTSNPSTGVQKIKVMVDPSVRVEPHLQMCTAMVLDIVETALHHYAVADRGHKHSSGISQVCFFVSYELPKQGKMFGNDIAAPPYTEVVLGAPAAQVSLPVSTEPTGAVEDFDLHRPLETSAHADANDDLRAQAADLHQLTGEVRATTTVII